MCAVEDALRCMTDPDYRTDCQTMTKTANPSEPKNSGVDDAILPTFSASTFLSLQKSKSQSATVSNSDIKEEVWSDEED